MQAQSGYSHPYILPDEDCSALRDSSTWLRIVDWGEFNLNSLCLTLLEASCLERSILFSCWGHISSIRAPISSSTRVVTSNRMLGGAWSSPAITRMSSGDTKLSMNIRRYRIPHSDISFSRCSSLIPRVFSIFWTRLYSPSAISWTSWKEYHINCRFLGRSRLLDIIPQLIGVSDEHTTRYGAGSMTGFRSKVPRRPFPTPLRGCGAGWGAPGRPGLRGCRACCPAGRWRPLRRRGARAPGSPPVSRRLCGA